LVVGVEVGRSRGAFDCAFARFVAASDPPDPPLREQIRWWLHHDERTYAKRLAELVAAIGGERTLPGAPGWRSGSADPVRPPVS
ncbi:MAG: hypothetical protein ACR2NV_13740, partial [Thermoleophilaceae bacterium]